MTNTPGPLHVTFSVGFGICKDSFSLTIDTQQLRCSNGKDLPILKYTILHVSDKSKLSTKVSSNYSWVPVFMKIAFYFLLKIDYFWSFHLFSK